MQSSGRYFPQYLVEKNFYNNIYACFEKANIPIAEMYLAPLAMADCVLTDSEKRAGCALIDLGADTTTVSVYYKIFFAICQSFHLEAIISPRI